MKSLTYPSLNVRKPRVLVVDDNHQNVKVVHHYLKDRFLLETAYSGVEALGKLFHLDFDLVLLDIQMPKMNGFEVATKLKENAKTKDIPVVFLTGYGEEKWKVKQGMTCGGSAYLNKPVIETDLLSIVDSLTNKELTDQVANHSADMQVSYNALKDSMDYSKRIIESVLPSTKDFKSAVADGFIYFQPKEQIGGDFYWMRVVHKKLILGLFDCTGHGVPGALISMAASNFMNQIVCQDWILDPGEILSELNRMFHKTFGSKEVLMEGMEAGIVNYNYASKELLFSGAKRNLVKVKEGTVDIIDRNPYEVGYDTPPMYEFNTQRQITDDNAAYYLFSDGYADQIGGPDEKRMKSNLLFKHIKEVAHLPMSEQEDKFRSIFSSWKNGNEQLDDVSMIGFRL